MRIEDPLWSSSVEIKKIFKALEYRARFVGGCVRDSLLKIEPKDFDIATPFSPLNVKKRLNKAGYRVLLTGLKYGCVTVLTKDKRFPSLEITTLRQDVETDGRHAKVSFTRQWHKDAVRRDFTMNALYADLKGNVYDYCHGLDDLFSGTLRFIGNPQERLKEDYLRILRYFRFFAFYSKKEIDNEVLALISQQKENLSKVSIERVRNEFSRLFSAKKASEVLKNMAETGVLQRYFPNPSLESFTSFVSSIKNPSAFYCFFSLIPFEEREIFEAQKRWGFGRKEIKKIRYIKAYKALKDPQNYTFNDLFRFVAYFKEYEKEELLSFLQAKNLEKDWLSLKEKVQEIVIPPFDFSGESLLPFVQGQKVKEYLDLIYEYWLSKNGQAKREDLIAYMQKLVKES